MATVSDKYELRALQVARADSHSTGAPTQPSDLGAVNAGFEADPVVTAVPPRAASPQPSTSRNTGLAHPLHPSYDACTNNTVWHTGQQTTVVVNTPATQAQRPGPVTRITHPEPMGTVCYNCGQEVVTYLYHEAGTCTYVACVALACIGCDLGCCLLPFCVDQCKDRVHKCPRCHVMLGKHRLL